MRGKFKLIRVPKTTNNITQAIINHLLSEGHSASRVNVQGQWDEIKQLWRPSGSRKGMSDIVGAIRSRYPGHHGGFLGVAIFIEVKKGADEMSEDQIKFMQEIRETGGIYFEAKDYDNYLDWYNLFIKNNYL